MRNYSAEILSVPVPILIKIGFSFFKSVKIYFAGTDYKSARSGHYFFRSCAEFVSLQWLIDDSIANFEKMKNYN
ncbi:hypothetical protein IW20_16075 [Flavobacterium hydatis]|uniref:Uncharacterized protein n=1 Tax=Flavobacterium hydatis TaxID=991 RepID=A0A086AEQ9_FLAHY|nr:hypothetical protein IW20_16075 [Flavobacterium hydatis]